jgi:hypothetical protein
VRRTLLPALLLCATIALPARGQDSTRVLLEIGLAPDSATSGFRLPLVRTRSLLQDDRWEAMLESGFPVRMHYRLELWRGRDGWFDAMDREVEWDVVVRHEPLLDQYTVTRLIGRQQRENRYATLAGLGATLGSAYRVAITPASDGRLYYVATLEVTTLSDSDLQELERFLKGDLPPAAGGTDNVGGAVGRGATRLVLKLAGLPSLTVQGKSEKFEVRSGR